MLYSKNHSFIFVLLIRCDFYRPSPNLDFNFESFVGGFWRLCDHCLSHVHHLQHYQFHRYRAKSGQPVVPHAPIQAAVKKCRRLSHDLLQSGQPLRPQTSCLVRVAHSHHVLFATTLIIKLLKTRQQLLARVIEEVGCEMDFSSWCLNLDDCLPLILHLC